MYRATNGGSVLSSQHNHAQWLILHQLKCVVLFVVCVCACVHMYECCITFSYMLMQAPRLIIASLSLRSPQSLQAPFKRQLLWPVRLATITQVLCWLHIVLSRNEAKARHTARGGAGWKCVLETHIYSNLTNISNGLNLLEIVVAEYIMCIIIHVFVKLCCWR